MSPFLQLVVSDVLYAAGWSILFWVLQLIALHFIPKDMEHDRHLIKTTVKVLILLGWIFLIFNAYNWAATNFLPRSNIDRRGLDQQIEQNIQQNSVAPTATPSVGK